MKRFFTCLCVLAIALFGMAFADERANKDIEVAREIARQLQANFDYISFFEGISWYDEDMDAIVLKLNVTDGMTHEEFLARRSAGSMQLFYDLFDQLGVYSTVRENMDNFKIQDMDVYVLCYSEDGVIEYLEANGNNLTELIYPAN